MKARDKIKQLLALNSVQGIALNALVNREVKWHRGCAEDYGDVKPKPTDFAFRTTNGVADDVNTDEDIINIIEEP